MQNLSNEIETDVKKEYSSVNKMNVGVNSVYGVLLGAIIPAAFGFGVAWIVAGAIAGLGGALVGVFWKFI